MRSDLIPIWVAAFAAAVFGVWWIPIRYLESVGLHGAWAGLTMCGGAALLAYAWLIVTRQPLALTRHALMGAGLIGVTISLYSTSLNYTDVVRAVLLFYLAPAWSKLIEWRVMKQPWHWSSSLTIAAALLGAFLTLGGEITGGALNLGDVLAILSGLAWASGAALVFTGDKPSPASLTAVATFSAVLVALPFGIASGLPTFNGTGVKIVSTAVGMGAVYVFPLILMTLWVAQRLSPALLTFLLSAEILTGVISGAILLDEPFGLVQAFGTCLIVLAAVSEVFKGLRAMPAKSH
jgi:drug/metabolite transporter (DMT)-like permease